MAYASPGLAAIYGVPSEALLGALPHGAALIVPEDRGTVLRHLETARQGEEATYEFRIQRPLDGTFRWIRNTDFPIRNDGAIPWVGGIAEDVSQL